MFSHENSLLKLGTLFESNDLQFKINGLALKKTLNSLTKFSNSGTRLRTGINKGRLDKLLHRRSLIGKKHSLDLWPFIGFLPDDAKPAKGRWQ